MGRRDGGTIGAEKGDRIQEGMDAVVGRRSTRNQPNPTTQTAAVLDAADATVGDELLRLVTPPNVPLLSNITSNGGHNNNLPIVSPLSLDGSFEEEDHTTIKANDVTDFPKVTRRTSTSDERTKSNKKGSSGNKRKNKKAEEKKLVFFDIGASFADNNKHLTDDTNNEIGTASLLFDDLLDDDDNDGLWTTNNMLQQDPVLSWAGLSHGPWGES
mmetsp:Transcript_18881/g.35129  ORF Transcript_18881/g.35129 Transcript_18881/m.35129 type:complete len:214 (+) Transcript_18881:205-846(+)